MTTELVIELIKISPQIMWVIVTVIFLIAFYKPIVKRLVPNVKELKIFGIEAAFFQQTLRKAAELKHKKITSEDEKKLIDRIQRMVVDFSKKKVLWIDDRPQRSSLDQNLLLSIGLELVISESSEDALEKLNKNEYNIIISDIDRGNEKGQGIIFLQKLRELKILVPLIFYVEFFKPEKGVPAYSFGITNDPKELVHLVLDIIDRGY